MHIYSKHFVICNKYSHYKLVSTCDKMYFSCQVTINLTSHPLTSHIGLTKDGNYTYTYIG